MAAVAHASPTDIRRLALVRTGPVVRPARTTLPVTVYRRRRAVAVLIVVSVGLALGLALQSLLGALGSGPLTASERPEAPPGRVYVVQPGDTFWAIAGRLHTGEDPRPLVARMVAAHGSAVLVAGERLVLPAAA
jgi:hypothetical protein